MMPSNTLSSVMAGGLRLIRTLLNTKMLNHRDDRQMDQVRYRSIIQSLLNNYYQMALRQHHRQRRSEVSDRLAFDQERDQYLWFRFGWAEDKLVQHIIVYICVKSDKIWVEQDATDLCIVDDLIAAGIPSDDIVLGFHHPSKRAFTDFAHVWKG